MNQEDQLNYDVEHFSLDTMMSTTKIVTRHQPNLFHRQGNMHHNQMFLPHSKNRLGEGGLRTKSYFKMSLPDKPLITVVTVVFNGEQYIEETILSVINQTYENIEYIIVDGGSNDDTIDIIRKYQHAIDYWVSEKDKGIYDAMNKGINLSSGAWINFMNSGDTFFSSETVAQIFSGEICDEKIIYGNVHVRYLNFSRIKRGGNPNKLWSGMQFCHQSAFVDVQYHKLKQFNVENKIAADLELFYSAFKTKEKFKYFDLVFSSVQDGGVSDSNRLQAVLASRNAVRNCGASRIVDLYYLFAVIDSLSRSFLKKILPASLVKKIIQFK